MRLPSPDRARTSAGILVAVAILILAGDFAMVQAASEDAEVFPFTATTGNATAVGMRVTNADQGDTIEAFQMIASAACGYAYRPLLRGNETIQDLGNLTQEELDERVRSPMVTGNVSFYVLESIHTADLLRGKDVPTYRSEARDFNSAPIILRGVNGSSMAGGDGVRHLVPDGNRSDDVQVERIVYHIRLTDCFRLFPLQVDRLDDPGTRTRIEFSQSEPWVNLLPTSQGVDFVYVVRSQDNDNETFALLQESLVRGIPTWVSMMDQATVFDQTAQGPDRVLRTAFFATFVGACILLALSLRRGPTPTSPAAPAAIDAAFDVAAAGERHLVNLRRALTVIGALLVPLLGAATYAAWVGEPDPPWGAWSPRSAAWSEQFFVAVHLVDAVVLVLWALTLRRVHLDLVAWRTAWTRLDRTSLDDL